MRLRVILYYIFKTIFVLLANIKTIGFENLPKSGGAILTPNHLGMIDAPLVFIHVRRDDLTALVAKKHQKNLILRWVVNSGNGIWINRDEPDSQAVRHARSHLQQGGMLGIAPEGTRSKTGSLLPGKTGVAYLADKGGVQIVPIGITGSYRGFYELLRFRRINLSIRFGKPYLLPPIERATRDADLVRNTEEIMCRIAALLPPSYRGVYLNHPRTLELIAEQGEPES